MFLRNLIMSITLAIFFMCYCKALADVAKKLPTEKQAVFVISDIFKKIFLGATLNILLTLLGFIPFSLSNVFICSVIVIFLDTVG